MKQGYSLIELSIVLAILAIILGLGLASFNKKIMAYKSEITASRLARIMQAAEHYARYHNTLPCPAERGVKSDEHAGQALATNGLGECIDSSGTVVGNNALVYGDIPHYALGLSAQDMNDGWGRRFAYIVAHDVIKDGSLETYSPLDPNAPDGLTLQYANNNSQYAGSAALIVISYGQDQLFSFPALGGCCKIIQSTSSAQQENRLLNSYSTQDAVFYMQSPALKRNSGDYFDDIIAFKTYAQLIK